MKHTKTPEVTYTLLTLPKLKPQYAGTSKLLFNVPSISEQFIDRADYGISILSEDEELVPETPTETED